LVVVSALLTELFERDGELVVVSDLVKQAGWGTAGILFIEGPAGVGKTRLLEIAAEMAGREAVCVLRARGGELERSFPFGLATQLLGPAVSLLKADERRSVLSGAAALAAEIVDPRARVEANEIGRQEALYARLYGLYWVCAGLSARQPIVLAIDDAHWGDDASLQWLLFMARRAGDLPLTLVVSARPAESGEWPKALAMLAAEPSAAFIRPQPLSELASKRLIADLLGDEPDERFAAACHRATGGNPFLLTELVASAQADGLSPTASSAAQILSLAPEGVTRSVLVRLGRLSRAAGALARCVAVLGSEAELRHAAWLAGLDPDQAAAAADALTAAGFLNEGRPLRLIHPVVRTSLYAELPEGQRAQLHRRAARLLADEQADLDAVGAHLVASEPAAEPWAVAALLQAAKRAASRGAPTTSLRYLRRALQEPPSADRRAVVLRYLSVVETTLGEANAAEHAREAMDLTSDPHERVWLAYELSTGYLVAGRWSDAVDLLEQALEYVSPDNQDSRWRLEAHLISLARHDPRQVALARHYLDRVPDGLAGATPGERAILAELAYAALLASEPVDAVTQLAMRALGGGRLTTEQPLASHSVLNAIWALVYSEQHELAMRSYDALIARARDAGSPIAFAWFSSRRSQLHYLRGEIPDAIADAQASLDAGNQFGQSLLTGGLYARLIDALLAAGDIEGAARALDASGTDENLPQSHQFLPLIQSRGRLRLTQGATEAGIEDLLCAERLRARLGFTNPAGAHCCSNAAVALAHLGRIDEARKLFAGELLAARRFGAHGTLGIALRAAGMVEGGAAGIEYLREAVAHLKQSPARLELARAYADLGGALRRAGKRREAQQELRHALDLADRCGAKTIADQARSELVITGSRPRRARLGGVEALTASEQRVAQLAASGLTNRQIAQALFVSQATVVTHLSHCYQKLNVNSRQQLAREFAQAASAEQS
jgi:DNA-binding CsgD family transcriptional regulator